MMRRQVISAMVVLTLTGLVPMLASAGGMLFEDYFIHEMRDWDPLTCCWKVVGYANGKLLRQKSAEGKLVNTRIVISARSFTDSVIETKVRFGAYPSLKATDSVTVRLGAGLVFGYQDESNYYLFRLAGDDTVVLGKIVRGEWVELGSKAARKPSDPRVAAIEDAPWYTLKVQVAQGQITAYLDGSPVMTAEEGEGFTPGQVGLTTWNSMADFDYVKIWNP